MRLLIALILICTAGVAFAQTLPQVRYYVYGDTADLIATYYPPAPAGASESASFGPPVVYRFPFYGEAQVAHCRKIAAPEEVEATGEAAKPWLYRLYPEGGGEVTFQCVGTIAQPFDDPVSTPVSVPVP